VQQTCHSNRLPSATQTDYPNIPDGELLEYCHGRADRVHKQQGRFAGGETRKTLEDKYNFPSVSKFHAMTPIDWGANLEGLETTILKRRSTAPTMVDLTLDELKALLDFTYQPQHYSDQGLDETDYFDLNLIETFIACLVGWRRVATTRPKPKNCGKLV